MIWRRWLWQWLRLDPNGRFVAEQAQFLIGLLLVIVAARVGFGLPWQPWVRVPPCYCGGVLGQSAWQ